MLAAQGSLNSILSSIIQLDSARAVLIDTTVLAGDSLMGAEALNYADLQAKLGALNNDSSYTVYVSYLDSLLNTNSSITDTATYNALTNSIQVLYDSLGDIQQNMDNLRIALDSVRIQFAASAVDSNAAIVPSNNIEGYYQMANDIYLSAIAQNDSSFDSIQLVNLYQLAFMCPLKGGEAVFEARSMLSLVIDTFYDDDALCTCSSHESDRALKIANTDSATQQTDSIKHLIINMYPNPTKDYVILSANQDINQLVQLKITDALGAVLMNSEISIYGGTYRIDTSPFTSGIYSVALYNASGKLFGGKLTILGK